MLKSILTCATAIGLATTAALAEQASVDKAVPQYTTQTTSTSEAQSKVTTREDAQKLGETQFLAADVNVDGFVDGVEFAAFSTDAAKLGADKTSGDMVVDAPSADQAFAAIAKGDGKITKQEMIDARTKSFEAADGNRDKSLDAAEQKKFAALTMVRSEPAAAPVQ